MKLGKTSLSKVKVKGKTNTHVHLFTLTNNNMDVKINRDIGGHWKGFLFTELREDPDGIKLLSWVARSDFPSRVKEIAEELISGA
jgi:hypothetical protein